MKKCIPLLFTLSIAANIHSMENSKKRKYNRIEYCKEEQYKLGDKANKSNNNHEARIDDVARKIQAIEENLAGLPMPTSDIVDLLYKRWSITKAFWILSQLPEDLIFYLLPILFEYQVNLIINEIILKKHSNKSKYSNIQDTNILLQELYQAVNNYIVSFCTNITIIIKLIDKFKSKTGEKTLYKNHFTFSDNGLGNLVEIIKDQKIKKIIGYYFKEIVLEKFNIFENIELRQLLMQHVLSQNILCSTDYGKGQNLEIHTGLLNHLLKKPEQIPADLKTYLGHSFARADNPEKLLALIGSHIDPYDHQYIYDIGLREYNAEISPRLIPLLKSGTLLMTALFYKAFKVAKWLIKSKIQINHEDCEGNTALAYCIRPLSDISSTIEDITNYKNMVDLLLEYGSVNKLNEAYKMTNNPYYMGLTMIIYNTLEKTLTESIADTAERKLAVINTQKFIKKKLMKSLSKN